MYMFLFTWIVRFCPGVPVHKGITIVLSLFRSHWLAVVYRLVLCSRSCEPVHERTEPIMLCAILYMMHNRAFLRREANESHSKIILIIARSFSFVCRKDSAYLTSTWDQLSAITTASVKIVLFFSTESM